MNILFAYYYPSGGVETLARQRSHALKKFGIDFQFLYFMHGPGLQNIEDTSTFVTNSDHEIQEIIHKGNYKVIIVCSDHFFLPRVRKMNFTGKLIYEVQGLGSLPVADQWLKDAQPYINQNADAILFPKTSHLMNLIEKYYPSVEKFSFHNCIDTKKFAYKAIHSQNNDLIIGWVGRIEENKNWKGFLELGYELIKLNPLIKLWMFIDSTLTNQNQGLEFNRALQKYNLANHLTIRDNIPHQQMPEFYSAIGDSGGFLCSTSKVEGFGYAVLEGMSCRCPVLTTDSDGIKSFVVHNITGKIYPHDNIQLALKEAKSYLLNKPLREQISLNAQQFIHTHFTPENYAKNFLNMLKDLGVNTP